ncbi:MAG: hypothetical protein RBR12_02685 [Sulfurospirillum cavolei]|nr:hypothetical protein [Sulfurospirillum cavolei]
MELKEMILSTLKELEQSVPQEEKQSLQPPRRPEVQDVEFQPEPLLEFAEEPNMLKVYDDELMHEDDKHKQFYLNLRERILVLFEGFQSPNNKNIEAKIDLTLNFLEYLLATIDEQLEKMESRVS